MQLLALLLSCTILYGIRHVLSKRPKCQTGLCEEIAQAKADKNQEALDSDQKEDEEEFCFMCNAINKMTAKIRVKFTWMISILIIFQLGLELIYWLSQKDFIMRRE